MVAKDRWAPWLLLLVTVGLYLNTLPNQFVLDDQPSIELNRHIRSWSAAWEAVREGGARPLLTLTLAFNYALDGLNVPGYHLFNLLIHVAAGITLFAVVRRTLRLRRGKDGPDEGEDAHTSWLAFAVALLWLAHPLDTQAVTYLVQRGESMMALFFLLAMYAGIRQWQSPTLRGRIGWTIVGIAAALLGAMSKQVIVVLPLVMAAYDWVFLRPGSFKQWLRRRAALIAALLAVSVLLVIVSLGMATREGSSAGFSMPVVGPAGYLISQPGVILIYLWRAVWPQTLIFDYQWLPAIPFDTPHAQVWHLLLTKVLWQSLLVGGMLIASLIGLFKRKWWGFCGISFFLILAPTSSVMPIADLAVEHRMYLPLVCVVVLAVFAVMSLLRWLAPGGWTAGGAVLLLVVAMVLGARTVVRNADYRDGVSLWTTVVRDRPGNPRAWHNLGASLYKAGFYREAMKAYEKTLEILPSYDAAWDGIGDVWLQLGRPDEALPRLQKAVQLKPDDAGYVHDMGKALWALGRKDEARTAFEHSLEMKDPPAGAYSDLGMMEAMEGHTDDAIAMFNRAIERDPKMIAAYSNLAALYEKHHRYAEAIDVGRRALAVMEQIQPRPDKSIAVLKGRLAQWHRLAEQSADQPAPASP